MLILLSIMLSIFITAFFRDISVDFCTCISIALVSFTYLFTVITQKKYKGISSPLICGYLARVALLFYDVYSSDPLHLPLVGGELSSDPLRFFRAAISFSQGISSTYGGYFSRLTGLIFSFTGSSRLLGEFVVLLFSIATIHICALILKECQVSKSIQRKSLWIVCLFPNYLLLSVVFRRETIITCALAASVLFFLRWMREKNGELSFVFACVSALVASMFHGATGLIVVPYLLIHLIYDRKKHSFQVKANSIVATALLLVVFLIVFGRYGSTFFNKLDRLSGIEDVSSVRDVGGSSYARYVGDSKTPLRMLIFAIPRFAYYMFSPFPWQWRGINDIITFLMSSCFYFYVLWLSLMCIRKDKCPERKYMLMGLMFISLVVAFVFSWGVTNTGTATRHRDKYIVVYIVMYALCQVSRSSKKDKKIRRIQKK